MAVMIPDPCPSKATVGEKRVYSLLQGMLPDHFTSWYEPIIQGRYPDFTLLAGNFGLLVLEVKGWYLKQLVRVNDQDVELLKTEDGYSRVERVKNPTRQVRDYLFGMMDELSRPDFAILRNPDGEHKGKLCFPCGYGVVFTNITRAQLDEAGLSSVFPAERAICRDELASLHEAESHAFLRRLKKLFPAPFPFDPLTEDQVKTVKGLLHKEVIVRRRPATSASVPSGRCTSPDAVSLEVLDARQEQAVRALGDGHNVIFGVAGSGKTVLLLSRARLLAGRDPNARILVLCYNKALAAYLSGQLAGDPTLRNVEVRHFHSWAARKTGLRKHDDEPFESYEARVIKLLLNGAEQFPVSEKYDAILIDEGHDFSPDWIRCATGFLKGPEVADLMIVLDGAQGLYGRDRSFTWKSVGVRAVGRSRRLSRNYRNTKEIIEFAWQVGQTLTKVERETETQVRVLPTKAARRGPQPRYRGSTTVAEEHAIIARLVEGFKTQGIPESDIAVLYARKERDRIDVLCRALRGFSEVCWVSNEADPNGGMRSMARPGVRLLTIHAAKGLEFKAVIVSSADQLPNPLQTDQVLDSNLFYVALTRATDELAVTWTGRSDFTDRVLRTNKASRLPD